MRDLGHEVEDVQVFTWKLKNMKSLNRELTSTEFECGELKWYVSPLLDTTCQGSLTLHRRILFFPFGNRSTPPYDTVSIYLDSNPNNVPDDWHKCAQFAIVLSNPNDPTIYIEARTFLPSQIPI